MAAVARWSRMVLALAIIAVAAIAVLTSRRPDGGPLGKLLSKNLGLGVGDSLKLFGRTFQIVGIYDSAVPWEKSGAILPNRVIQEVLDMHDSVTMGFLFLGPDADWSVIKKAIEGKYDTLEAIRTEDFTSYYDQIEYIDWFVWIISLVSVAVGAF